MQIHNAEVLLDPFEAVSKRIGNLCLSALQLSAVGCSETSTTHHSVRPCDILRKCAQYAVEAGLSAGQLWNIMEAGRRRSGSTDLNGVVDLASKALPSVSANELAKLAALLLADSDSFSTSGQVNTRTELVCSAMRLLFHTSEHGAQDGPLEASAATAWHRALQSRHGIADR